MPISSRLDGRRFMIRSGRIMRRRSSVSILISNCGMCPLAGGWRNARMAWRISVLTGPARSRKPLQNQHSYAHPRSWGSASPGTTSRRRDRPLWSGWPARSGAAITPRTQPKCSARSVMVSHSRQRKFPPELLRIMRSTTSAVARGMAVGTRPLLKAQERGVRARELTIIAILSLTAWFS